MRKFIIALGMIALSVAAACTPSGPGGATGTPNPPFKGEPPQEAYRYEGEPGVYGGQLVLSIPDDAKTFNITRATDSATAAVLWYHVFICPIEYRNGGDPPDYTSGLCTKWEASPDAKQWTFYLRKGVLWSDGQPFTADDVVFTYDVTLDENVDTAARDIFSEGKDASGKMMYPRVEKLDDHTVRFTLNQPNGSFLDQVFNLWLIPKHKWEQPWRAGNFKDTMKISDDPNDIVSLGPFRIKEYVAGQRAVLERNPYYWKVDSKGQRLPYLDRLVFVIAKDFNAIQAKFQAGELDVMDRVRATDYALVKRLESETVKVEEIGVSYDTNWMVLNLNNGTNPKTGKPFVEPWKQRLFRNQKFRQAVSYAIDREGLGNTVFVGRGVPIYACVTPGDKYWYSDDVMKYPYDPDRARQMFAELGLKDTNGDKFLEDAEGHTVEINIVTNSSNSQRVGIANFISTNLQGVGIKANTSPVALGQLVDLLQSTFAYDGMVLGWQINPPPGPANYQNILLSSGLNHACFPLQKTPSTDWEARIDQIVYQISASPDPAERKRLFAEIQRIFSEQLPEINLVAQREAVAYRDKFGNLRPASLPPRMTWNADEIYIKK